MTDVVQPSHVWTAARETSEALGAEIVAASNGAATEWSIYAGDLTVWAVRERVVELLLLLRDRFAFQQLMDVAGADFPSRGTERFEVIYHLLSITRNYRVRVKTRTDEQTPVPSAIPAYPCADWFEREAFDMYGILFDGHPDLRRLLTDYGFPGHPLRKDFPVSGYTEVRWDEEQKRVVYEPVKLNQEFRTFDFLSPWEGARYVLPGDEKAGGPKS